MEKKIVIYTRLILIAIVCSAVFVWAWGLVVPQQTDCPLTLWQHNSPVKVLGVAVMAVVVCTAAGYVLGGKKHRTMTTLAAPLGLAFWALLTPDMNLLLFEHSDAASRAGLFRQFAFESVIWLAIAMLGWLVLLLGKQEIVPIQDEDDEQKLAEEARTGEKLGHKQPVHVVWGGGAVGMCVVAYAILRFTGLGYAVQADLIRPVVASIAMAKGQALFSTFIAFGLAAFIIHQFLRTPLPILLLGPGLLGLILFLLGGRSGVFQNFQGAPWPLLPADLAYLTILPVQFVTWGMLGIYLGHQQSTQLLHVRASSELI